MKKKLALIKAGGSLITDKTKPFSTREDAMRMIAKALHEAHDRFPETAFIVGNGAGSFGHYLASQEAGIDPAEKIRAIHESVILLNKLFVQHLVEEGLPAVTIVPAKCITAENGKVRDFNSDDIEDTLSINSIPVLFGDIVEDGTERGMIVSTEAIFELLVDALHEEYELTIMYLGETEGVLDVTGKTMAMISTDKWKEMKGVIQAPEGYDVTGGMTHKIESALRVASFAKDVRILSGKNTDAIADVLSGKEVGTRINA